MFTLFDECLCLSHADKAVQMQPIHTPQLRQALLQELRAVLHSPLHSRFSRPLPLLLPGPHGFCTPACTLLR